MNARKQFIKPAVMILQAVRAVETVIGLSLLPTLALTLIYQTFSRAFFLLTFTAIIILAIHRGFYVAIKKSYLSAWRASISSLSQQQKKVVLSYPNYSGPPYFSGKIGLKTLYTILATAAVFSLLLLELNL